jgi:hypothetical protein
VLKWKHNGEVICAHLSVCHSMFHLQNDTGNFCVFSLLRFYSKSCGVKLVLFIQGQYNPYFTWSMVGPLLCKIKSKMSHKCYVCNSGITEYWGEYMHLRGRKWRETGEDCIMRSFITCTLHQVLWGWQEQGVCDGWHTWDMRNAYKIFCQKTWRAESTLNINV